MSILLIVVRSCPEISCMTSLVDQGFKQPNTCVLNVPCDPHVDVLS